MSLFIYDAADRRVLHPAIRLRLQRCIGDSLISRPRLGRDLRRRLNGVALVIQTQKGLIDRTGQFGAVGLGDQDAVAIALTERIDVGRVQSSAHNLSILHIDGR